MSETLQHFFTFASLGTLAGASAAVIVVSNTIRKLLNWTSPWPSFITAMIIAFAGAYYANALNNILDVFLTILNSCLLFSSAAGMQEAVVSASQPRPMGQTELHGQRKTKWFSSWFR